MNGLVGQYLLIRETLQDICSLKPADKADAVTKQTNSINDRCQPKCRPAVQECRGAVSSQTTEFKHINKRATMANKKELHLVCRWPS
jgi:hypothetical protein